MRPVPKQRVSSVVPINAPTGGIDDSSPLSNMGEQFAIEMVNWYPEGTSLRVRDGYREHATNLATNCKTLMAYRPGNPANNKLFACTDSGIYDITVPSASPSIVHPLTNGDVQWTQFSNIAGTWLVGCNGTDPAFLYNGSTWIDFTAEVSPTTPGEIAGLAPTSIIGVLQHKNRLWFIEKDSLTAYYWPLNAVAGTATAFPLGGIAQMGGYLNAIFTWTMDAAYSIDDMMFFQTSNGELLAYGGTDPANAETWFLSARYFAGAPMSRRCQAALNGDMLLMTEFGLVSLAKVVAGQQSFGAKELTTSARIGEVLSEIIRTRSGATGWEVAYSPAMQYFILGIPDFFAGPAIQFIMNATSGAWTTYDLPALTFLEYDGFLYFSDINGRVLRHGDTSADNVLLDGSNGTPVVAAFKQAYSYFGQPTVNKNYKLIRPIFESTVNPSYTLMISPDFEYLTIDDLDDPGSPSTGAAALWGSALWGISLWSPPALSYQEWTGLWGAGYCASLLIKVSTTSKLRYVAAHWAFEAGISI